MTDALDRYIDALEKTDHSTRPSRAERLQWLSQHQMPPAFGGSVELIALLEEARGCFVGGHPVAVLLTATAAIEHILEEALEAMEGKRPPSFEVAILRARKANLFAPEDLDDADTLRLLRNPFAHVKDEGHPDTLTERFRKQRVHPRTLQEADAKLALKAMHRFLRRSLEFSPPLGE